MADEYEKVFEREGKEFLREDYKVHEGEELPEFPGEPSGYKIILKDEDDNYYSTLIYENLDEAMGDAASLEASYGLDHDSVTTLISVYFPI